MVTPIELADELGVPPIEVRRYLRAQFPRSGAEKNQRWHLSDDVAAAVRAHFGSRTGR